MWMGFSDAQRKIIKIVLGVILIGMAFAIAGGFYDAERREWMSVESGIIIQALGSTQVGAWAQALGAMAAVFAAVWVMYSQQKNQINKENEHREIEFKNLVQAVRSEIIHTVLRLETDSKIFFTQKNEKGYFPGYSNMEQKREFIYLNRVLHQENLDLEIKADIMHVYDSIHTYQDAIRGNNWLIGRYSGAMDRWIDTKDSFYEERMKIIEANLISHADSLVAHFENMKQSSDLIEIELQSNGNVRKVDLQKRAKALSLQQAEK